MYFDAHSDIWNDVTIRRLRGETDVLRSRGHLAKMRRGGVEGSIFVIWVDPPYDADYYGRAEQYVAAIQAEAAECPDIKLVRTYGEIEAARAAGQIYIIVGMEGCGAVGEDLSRIDHYYDFGVRHMGLTWNESNPLASGAMSGRSGGLTTLGKAALARMQKKGILVDTAHLNEAGFRDVARLSRAPFVNSHSNAAAVCRHPRNLTDDQLRAIRDAGGVVGLNSYPYFIDSRPEQMTVRRLAEHAAHMIDVMGIDHVGLGFDFVDYVEDESSYSGDYDTSANVSCTAGLANITEAPNLFAELRAMGMSDSEMEKIARGNFLRVIKETIG